MAARILIAEDHPASMELMRYLLEANGYSTLTAGNGEVAVAVARRDRPDLIVCDLQMPNLNGYEVLEALKLDANLQCVPVIAVTAFSMMGDREKVLTAGFDGYFSKPIEPETFITQMELFLPPALRGRRPEGE
ncbi:response regulator [Aromatoleum diolicum]|uniref:Response regulator n=1 Tax=Aromatoleum diolicum TaxID=75796 RepID=A0ABX1QFY2_9RHOO|nr:response regulator [Aromatoleum diolicum]NMG76890.1 response regulator [Aromatoleum diolicum]